MDDGAWLAQQFENNRGHLRGVAYRILGSVNEADDAVQETWLRLSRSDAGSIQNLSGWLTTVVARICLDMLRSRTARAEESLDGQLASVTNKPSTRDPEQETLLADSVGVALLVVLDRLNPTERLAFVLHDVFAVPFEEIAAIIDRTPEAARQLASRARRRVRSSQGIERKCQSSRTAKSGRRVSESSAERRFRSACRGARSRRVGAYRRGGCASGRSKRDPWRAELGTRCYCLLADDTVCPGCLGGRLSRSCICARWEAFQSAPIYDRPWKDCSG
jgi:RNA polymerase sigma factor (sigma-70 family)